MNTHPKRDLYPAIDPAVARKNAIIQIPDCPLSFTVYLEQEVGNPKHTMLDLHELTDEEAQNIAYRWKVQLLGKIKAARELHAWKMKQNSAVKTPEPAVSDSGLSWR